MVFKSEGFLFFYMFMIGLRGPMASHTISLLLQESGLPEYRSFYSMTVTISDNSTSLLLSLFFYYIGDWRYVVWFNITVVTIGFVLIVIFVPESARFLHNTRRFKRARKSYNFLARMSGKLLLTQKLSGEESNLDPSAEPNEQQVKAEWKDMLRQPYCYFTFFAPLALFTSNVAFYGILMGLNKLSGSITQNGLFVGCADIMAGLLLGFLANIVGRVKYYIFNWLLMILSFIVYFFVQNIETVQYVPVLFGKFGTTSTFSLIYLISGETVPTNLRGSFIGMITAFSRFGSALGPIVADYLKGYEMWVYAALGTCCALGALRIKETLGKPMAEGVQPRNLK